MTAATAAAAAFPPEPLRIALIGSPNCGKTALFNRLTGSRQKVANYAGVTVERKVGRFVTPGGRSVRVLDLPGAYSLDAVSPDEAVTRDVCHGRLPNEPLPDVMVCVADATNLRLHLRFILELRALGRPMAVALNMMDAAAKRGISIDVERLSREIGVPVVETIAVRADGVEPLLALLDRTAGIGPPAPAPGAHAGASPVRPAAKGASATETLASADHAPMEASPGAASASGSFVASIPASAAVAASASASPSAIAPLPGTDLHREVRRLMNAAVRIPRATAAVDDAIDRVVLHPVWGLLILAAAMFLMFQAVFSWAQPLMDGIEAAVAWLGEGVSAAMPDGPLRSLLVDGVLTGIGRVLVFLPQILILFFFILILEESGYLPRAAVLLDRLMMGAGLTGRSFIPLLSSFACAVPGIMAARTINDPRDRLATILVAPLMACSARLPVYALLIGAFIPDRLVAGFFNLQGLVLFVLYLAGIVLGVAVAYALKRIGRDKREHSLLLELPSYRSPNLRDLTQGLLERANIFIRRVGTIILPLTILLWFLASFPAPPDGATGPAIDHSFAGWLGRGLEVLFAPLGFNWQICIALVPGLAAREVAVSSLATVYALSAANDAAAEQLAPIISAQWPLAVALSLLAWYVVAPMCLSTLAVIRRETGSAKLMAASAAGLFALAYVVSFVVYRVAVAVS